MKCIHFVLPNMTEKGQACTPKQANVPHYQTTLETTQLKMDSFLDASGDVLIYHPDKAYSNKFLCVTNSGVPKMEGLDWDELAKLAFKGDTQFKQRYMDPMLTLFAMNTPSSVKNESLYHHTFSLWGSLLDIGNCIPLRTQESVQPQSLGPLQQYH